MREHIIKLKKGFGTYNPNYYDKFLNQVDYNNMDLYHLDKAIEKEKEIEMEKEIQRRVEKELEKINVEINEKVNKEIEKMFKNI